MSITSETAGKIIEEQWKDMFKERIAVECGFNDKWESAKTAKSTLYAHLLTDIKFDGKVLTATESYSKIVPMKRELAELAELTAKWSERGHCDSNDIYYAAEDLRETLMESVEMKERKVKMINPKFYLSRVATEEEAIEIRKNIAFGRIFGNARIVGLSTSAISNNL